MPTPAKPCGGRFSDEVQAVLSQNRGRAQWATYACEVCGARVGAVQLQGKWVPEQHWPSVKYPPREPVTRSDRSRPRREDAVPAGSAFR